MYNFYFSIGTFYINSKLHIRNKISIKTIYSTIFFVSLFLRKTIDYIIGTHKSYKMYLNVFQRGDTDHCVSTVCGLCPCHTPKQGTFNLYSLHFYLRVFATHIFSKILVFLVHLKTFKICLMKCI